jgi:hypothetical protein
MQAARGANVVEFLHTDDSNEVCVMSDTRPDYDRVTFDVPLGMRDEIKRLAKAKTGLSLASYLKQLIAQDLGVQIDMKPQVADNTGKRKKS